MLPRRIPRTPHAPRRTPLLRIFAVLVALVAGLIAGAVSTAGPASATVPPRTAVEKTIDWAIFDMINAERAAHGLRPVTMVPALRLSARRHNLTMAAFNEMSHQLPGEPNFAQRETNAGYNWSWAGENIAWNSEMTLSGVKLLERIMYNEKPPDDGHRLNILSTHFHNVGVDVYMDQKHHKVWLTTDFGSRF
jgi:uncharacterized protein YkwD